MSQSDELPFVLDESLEEVQFIATDRKIRTGRLLRSSQNYVTIVARDENDEVRFWQIPKTNLQSDIADA